MTDIKTTIAEQLEVLQRDLGQLIARAETGRALEALRAEAAGPVLEYVRKLADEAREHPSETVLFAINGLIFSVASANTLIAPLEHVKPGPVAEFTRRLSEALDDVAPAVSD